MCQLKLNFTVLTFQILGGNAGALHPVAECTEHHRDDLPGVDHVRGRLPRPPPRLEGPDLAGAGPGGGVHGKLLNKTWNK